MRAAFKGQLLLVFFINGWPNRMTHSPWKIDWNDGLVLGIPEIDDDHKRFASQVNDLNSAIAGRPDKAEIRNRIDLLYLDAKDHFQYEERLLGLWAYPDHAQHALLHRQIEEALLHELAAFVMSKTSAQWVESGLHIKDLLVGHLLDEDMKYRDFLRSKIGIAPANP